MNINRKTFIGGLVAGISSIGFDAKAYQFEDIQIDHYYILSGKDTISVGFIGSDIGKYLIQTLKYEANFRPIEEVIDELVSREFKFKVTAYIFYKGYLRYDDIHLTKEWLTEFYNRHKDEDESIWDKMYTAKLNELTGVKK